jgi:hypothetical protein
MILYAAFLRKDTLTPDNISAMKGLHRARRRLDQLRQGVRAAYERVQTDISTHPPQPGDYLTVFLAPEYFFARDCESQHRFIEREEKHDIVRGLAALSLECPRTLLIPGTVPWWRPLYQGVDDNDRVAELRRRIHSAKIKQKTSMGCRYPRLPGWGFATPSNNVARPKASADWDQGKRDIQTLIADPDQDPYIAQNTAYIAYEGKVLKYHKRANFKELNGESEHSVVYAPGSVSGRFSVGPLLFGLEVCLDHDIGMLGGGSGPSVHVQIVVSASVRFKLRHRHIVKGGVFLHADCQQKDTEIHGGKAPHVRVTGHASSGKMLADGMLRLYKVTLDDSELHIQPAPAMTLDREDLGEAENPPPVTLKTRLKRLGDRIRS